MLLFASGKPLASEAQACGFTKAQLVFQERVVPAKQRNCTRRSHYQHGVLLRAKFPLKGSPRQRMLPAQL